MNSFTRALSLATRSLSFSHARLTHTTVHSKLTLYKVRAPHFALLSLRFFVVSPYIHTLLAYVHRLDTILPRSETQRKRLLGPLRVRFASLRQVVIVVAAGDLTTTTTENCSCNHLIVVVVSDMTAKRKADTQDVYARR